jgi:serine/threonine protein phosphatase 1
MTRGRTIAVGDIHGCSAALAALLDAVRPGPDDTVVTLGDYIDRGPDSRGVLNQLVNLAGRCRLVPLLGNHEELLVAAARDRSAVRSWLSTGGAATLLSYGWAPGGTRRRLADWIPERHWDFLADCRAYHETDTHLFVHAGYVPELPLDRQPGEALRWRVTDARAVQPHASGKVAVVGHTPQRGGEVLDLGFLVCIDTNCHRGGWLTALEVHTGQVWQADPAGRLRAGTSGLRCPPAAGSGPPPPGTPPAPPGTADAPSPG